MNHEEIRAIAQQLHVKLPMATQEDAENFLITALAAINAKATPVGAAPLPDAQLCRFYDVDNFPDLVAAMDHHIEKLQAKLPPTPTGWSDTDWLKHLQEQHPLSGLHINQGSMDAAADAYEAEYNAKHNG